MSELDAPAICRELAEAGWRVYTLPSGIRDKPSFFDAVRGTLPLDPPLRGKDNWDALSDSLWYGLHALPTAKIAVFWPGSLEMANACPEEYRIAVEIFSDLCESLADPVVTVGSVKEVVVVVA